MFHLVLWHAVLGWQEGQLTCKKCCLSETGEGKTDGELANSIDTKTHAACPKHIIIIIIKGIYIAQVHKGHKCAMSAEMAVWLRNCNIHSWVSQYQKGKTNLDFTEARDIEWQWHQLDHMPKTGEGKT